MVDTMEPRIEEAEPLEIDPEVLEDDGPSFTDISEDLNSFTTSCQSSATHLPFENGRRYHSFKSGAYPLPNDEQELDRLNVVHHMLKKALGNRLYTAPLDEFQRVLDIGTGTGVWAMKMGDAFPVASSSGMT